MTNLEDIRVTNADVFAGTSVQLGPFVAKAHMRNVLALQYQIISGAASSGLSVNVYDNWGTSNSLIDKFVIGAVNLSGNTSGLPIMSQVADNRKQWPMSPRPDFPIGHVKESGVASIQSSGAAFAVTMVYTDRPGGVY
ncbi:MAG: hypothetical protein O8C67_05140 [Candidatus Methanoperedens sp.]|nr:hypothetical protein [Candidatus Methanoperedens sp.]